MSKRCLEREYIDSPLNRMCCMAMPQLVWMDMEASSSSPLAAYISNRLSSEVSLSSGTRKYIAVSFAAAKRVKKLERVTGHSNSPCFGSFSKEVNLTAIGENFDVLPSDNRDLRNSATQEVRALDQDVIALGVAVEVSGSGDGCKEQADLLLVQRERGLLGMEQRATRHRVTRHPCNR